MIPRPLRHELHRTALLDHIEGSEATLVLLVAPSGFGKTALMAQCARQEDRRAAWLSLTPDDHDPAVFNTRLLRALQETFPDTPLPDGPPEFMDARSCARALNTLDEHALLVLDHLHLAHTATLRWLADFLNELHEGHRVLAAAPRRPALPLPTAFMAERLLLISGDQLQFTAHETQQYFTRRGAPPPDPTVTRGLSGWPAGLALLAADAHGTFSPLDLVRDLLHRLPGPVRAALPEAATLEEWSESGAREAGLTLPDGWIQTVQDAGLPLTPVAPDRYAPLRAVQDVLREELNRTPERAAQLYRRAAEHAETRGEPLLALQLYERGGHADPAQHLAARLCGEYLWRIDYPSVLSTLESLRRWQPLPPPLEAALALALIRTDRVQDGETLAATLLERELEPDALRALAHAAHRRGDRHMQLHYARLLARHARTRSQKADAARLEVAALLRLGQPQEAAARAEVLLDTSQALHPLEWAGTYFTLHTVYEDLRDPVLSEQHLRSALDLYESMHSHQQIAVCLNDLAILRAQAGAHEEAQGLVTRALHLIGDSMPDLRVVYLETQADLLLWNADFSGAEHAYTHALRAAQDRHLAPLVTRIQLGRAHALTQLGAFSDAHAALDAAAANLPPPTSRCALH
ncbi:AAA family ATPase [Deinococcus sp. JMULE3]|uniref:AAA family ATPase n=1 Tax=Deinococcus sp. JMULE3 TaxID=2518341 RepID=UPI0015766DB5|nr:AAA family ATPase [Deinococcus sp. JMULE3]